MLRPPLDGGNAQSKMGWCSSSRPGAPSSIAVVGFALSSYIVGVERGWLSRRAAAERTLVTLRFFLHSEQSASSAVGD